MKLNRKKLVGIITVIEILAIIGIGFYMYKRWEAAKYVLSKVVVTPISKNVLLDEPTSELKYFYELTPNNSWSDEPSWLGYKAVYTINTDTLNERYDYQLKKQDGVFRIITLGDSFTFGQYVSTADNWSEVLEDSLNRLNCKGIKKFEVINLGVPGYDVEYIAQRYAIRGEKYNPDLIIWHESGSGFNRINELRVPYEQKIAQTLTQQEIANAQKQGDYWLAWTKADGEVFKNYTGSQIAEIIGRAWQKFFLSRGDTKVLVATFPYVTTEQLKQLNFWFQGQKNVSIFNDLPDVRLSNLHVADGHPSIEGHQMIAESILNYLKNSSIISCSP